MGDGTKCYFFSYVLFKTRFVSQALEDGEDIQELADRTREKKERRAQNKFLRDAEASGRNTPASDSVDGRGRKPKKGKAKANNDYEPSIGSKRKRGMKSMSATPDVDDDNDDHDTVCLIT